MRPHLLLSALLLAGCFGTEIPPQKPAEDPMLSAPPAKTTTDATKIEDKPGERKPSKPDAEQTKGAINRATRQASQCPQIHTEGPFGDFSVTLVLSEKGKIAEARLPPDLADKPIGKCVKKAYEAEMFPPWEGFPVNENVTLTLKKGEAATPAASASAGKPPKK